MTGNGRTAGNSLRHKGLPAHWTGNDGLAGFSGLRKGDWPRGDTEMGAGVCPGERGMAAVNGAPPGAGREPGGAGKKKSRAKGPAQVNQAGMSGCSVLASTANRGQTCQAGTEEEHGAGFGDGSLLSEENYIGNSTTIWPKT